MFDIVITSAPATPFAARVASALRAAHMRVFPCEISPQRPPPDALRVGAASEIGREIGVSLAAVVKHVVAEPSGAAASPQLLAGALDDALASAGLGRVALDLTRYADRGEIGCLMRPPVEIPAQAFAAFYAGLLGAALSAALGRDLTARCLDNLDLTPLPWLFTVTPSDPAPETP